MSPAAFNYHTLVIAACDDKIDSSYVELTGEFRHIADIDFTEDISLTLFSFPPQDEKLSFRFTFFILSNGQSIEIAQGSYAISFIPNKIWANGRPNPFAKFLLFREFLSWRRHIIKQAKLHHHKSSTSIHYKDANDKQTNLIHLICEIIINSAFVTKNCKL